MPLPKQIAALAGAGSLLCAGCVRTLPPDAYAQPAQPQAAYAPQAEPPPPPEAQEAQPTQAPNWSPAQLDALVGPVALYPDPLIAILLPASTSPSDVVAAATYLVQYGDRTQIDYQPWDPSVRALAHYPSVIAWMAQNMDWVSALGSAFASSPAQIMEAVQRMRQKALAAGTLVSTQQQAIYSDDGYIEIYPADPGYLYVPSYDPGVVYADQAYDDTGPFMNFGPPYPEGDWLSFYFDWGTHRVWHGGRDVWAPHTGWRPPPARHPGSGAQAWRARPWVSTGPARSGAAPSPKALRPAPPAPVSRARAEPVPRAAPRPGARPIISAPPAFHPAPRMLPPAPRLPSAARPAPARAAGSGATPRQPPPPPPSRKPDNGR